MPPEDQEALRAIAADLEQEGEAEADADMEGEEGGGGEPLTANAIALQASLRLGAGVALCAIFSDPLVEALSTLSRETGVPPFFVGFVLTPFASNASEIVSSLAFAARKRKKNISLSLSQVYGAVTMNNTLVLGLFLLVVYYQKLDWVYSSEVLVIAIGTLAIGLLGYSGTTFKASTALPVLAIYPASLLTVYLLDTFLGWQ
ncbi:hypothetical protein FOA52_007706 [Chlamydomonas sp. UWO 241]|nr:hypothetical protein FOA52_007706 [Chlamydomonas sp. UWO 241]